MVPIERIKEILLRPQSEWLAIESEQPGMAALPAWS